MMAEYRRGKYKYYLEGGNGWTGPTAATYGDTLVARRRAAVRNPVRLMMMKIFTFWSYVVFFE
jgi:hypothetical protein